MSGVIDVLLSRGVDTIYFLDGEDKIFGIDARCLGYRKFNQWILYPKPMGPALDEMRKCILGDAGISSNSSNLEKYSLTDSHDVFLFTLLFGTHLKE